MWELKKKPTSEGQQSSAAVATKSASVTAPQVIAEAPDTGFAEVSLGDAFTCARTKAGQVYCWGSNEFGGLGSPDAADQHRPCRVPLPSPAIQIGSGAYYSCALLDTRQIACWGSREKGNIGDGKPKRGRPTAPVTLALSNVVKLVVTPSVVFAVGDDGTVHTWGGFFCTREARRSPEPCIALKGASAMREFFGVGCWADSSGVARCWGEFTDNCGNRKNAHRDPPGELVSLPGRAVDFVQAFSRICALMENGDVYCWGSLPFEGMGCPASPQKVPSLSNVASMRMELDTLCAVRNDGSAWCAGDNETGVLGDGTRKFRGTFAPIQGLVDVKQIDVGTHACAVTNGGKLYCWGKNDHGQLGDGTVEDRLTPVEVVFEDHKQQ